MWEVIELNDVGLILVSSIPDCVDGSVTLMHVLVSIDFQATLMYFRNVDPFKAPKAVILTSHCLRLYSRGPRQDGPLGSRESSRFSHS